MLMQEGQQCSVTCAERYNSVGHFKCLHEMVVGKSVCVTSSQIALVAVVTKVAGTMEVELHLEAELTQEELSRMFQSGIAGAVAIPMEQVAKLAVSETLQGKGQRRRLQVNQTTRYDVTYEVIVPDSMDPDVVVNKANNITHPDTVEAQVFQTVLMGTFGVAQVQRVLTKIPAFKFEDEVAAIATSNPNQAHDETASWGLIVLIILLSVLCLVLSTGAAVVFQRKRATAAMQDDLEGLREAADHGSVVARIPSHTLLDTGSSGEETLKNQISSFEV